MKKLQAVLIGVVFCGVIPHLSLGSTAVDVRIEVTTGREVYTYGESVNITVTNVDSLTAAGDPNLQMYLITDDYYYKIRDVFEEELIFELKPGESFTYVWDQTDDGGVQVPRGAYEIVFYFIHCKGIQAKDSAVIRIQGPVYIETIGGGIGASAAITNIGKEHVHSIPWSIHVVGTVMWGSHHEGIVTSLAPGETTVITTDLLLGIGPAMIIVRAGESEETAHCFLVGSLVLGPMHGG